AAALGRVLELAPDHDDAFARLRELFRDGERQDELAALYGRRLEVEGEPLARARLHRALAELARSRGDADGAREHLRAVLDSAPGDLGALTALSEIAWEQGAWDEAASALIARARQESEPARLKDIFMR